MSGLCAFKGIFGEPGQGAHSYRFAGIAVIDVLATVVLAGIVAWLTSWSFWKVLIVLFLLGILFHRLFCVRTTVDQVLFS